MDTNNAMPPRAPNSSQAQPPVDPATSMGNKNTDLYEAISRDDEEVVVVPKKKRPSPFMGSVVLFMKVTFYLDSVRRSHESFFHLLGCLWAGFMGLLYLGGLITLFLSFYARARLPQYLENFFSDHNLKYDSLKMADYSLSRILVVNLHDNANKYVIPQLNIHSTFADFLQGRIRTVTADGLKLNLKSAKSDEESLDNLLTVLGMIANPMEAGLDLKINSITINNGLLNIEGKKAQIPVNFSMSGLYTTKKNQVIIPFTINEDFLKMDAALTVGGNAKKRKLDLAIKSGSLTLNNRAPEDLQGEVTLETDGNKIAAIQASINLNYGHSLKTIQTNLTHTEKGYKGNLSFLYKNTAENNAKPLADLTLSLDNLSVTKEGVISSSAPLPFKIKRLTRNTTHLEGVEGILKGQMNCNLPAGACSYDLSQETNIHYQNLSMKYKDQSIVIDEPGDLAFQPSRDTLSLQLDDSRVGINWQLSNIDLKGYYNVQTNPLNVKARSAQLSGSFSTQIQEDSFDINVEDGFYKTPNLTMEKIRLSARDLYNPTMPVQFSAQDVITNSSLLMKPVSVALTYTNQQVKANVRIQKTNIALSAEGVFQPFQKTFVGQFKMPAINLKDIPFPLHELSAVFPKSLRQLSGQAIAAGQLHFSGTNNIAGPFYLGLKNVHFHVDDTPISNVNTVVALQSLVPLVSAPNQTLSIGKIDALVPLTNIRSSFQFENQALRLLALDASLGDENLALSTALIPYRKPNAILYLKTNKDFEIAKIAPFLNLPGMTPVGGTGSLNIPVDVSENGVSLSSVTLKVNNTTFRKAADKKDIVGLFQQKNDAYMVRSGQLIFDKEKKLQLDLDGWLMPMRKREAFSKKDIQLTTPLFKAGPETSVPEKIQSRQKSLFQMLLDRIK